MSPNINIAIDSGKKPINVTLPMLIGYVKIYVWKENLKFVFVTVPT